LDGVRNLSTRGQRHPATVGENLENKEKRKEKLTVTTLTWGKKTKRT